MDAKKLAKAALPATLGGYLHKTASSHGGHGEHASPPRVTTHNGHKIFLETIYRVTVDGKKVELGIMVDDEGHVHCHSLPNYQFQSALDMVRAIIDQFPEDFKKRGKDAGTAHKHAAPRKAASKKKSTRGKSS